MTIKRLITLSAIGMTLLSVNAHAEITTSAPDTKLDTKTVKSSVKDSSYLPKTNITATTDNLSQVGYSLGYLMGEGNKDSVDDLRLDAFFQGFRDAYVTDKPALDKKQMQKVLVDYQKRKEAEFAKKIEALANENLAKEKAFLARNAKKSGIKTTASGLQYEVLKQGNGKTPTAKDTVKVHYEGRLLDGTIFDSSYKRGEPMSFPLSQVIKGWTEGLQLMKTGSKYRLYVPSELGYGEAGNTDIEPNSLLIFDVELLEVNPKADKIK